MTNATPAEATAWLTNRLPDEWRSDIVPEISVDREEIVVLLGLGVPEVEDQSTIAAATEGRIAGFREATRDRRISIALEAEALFERKVSWGVRCGDRTAMFTHLAAPVMTRLRQPERLVLDTLVAGGVARSRSDALAWCVRLVGQHTGDWLDQLRTALQDVDRIRSQGPEA
jgi:hypothetical protein